MLEEGHNWPNMPSKCHLSETWNGPSLASNSSLRANEELNHKVGTILARRRMKKKMTRFSSLLLVKD